MAKPVDMDDFFKEQQERLNISDSDWDEYEERIYEERKRKRAQHEIKKTEKSNNLHELPAGSHRAEASNNNKPLTKKQKVAESTKTPESSSTDISFRPTSPNILSHSPTHEHEEVAIASSLRRASSYFSTRPRKVSAAVVMPTPSSSDVTTPRNVANSSVSSVETPQFTKDTKSSRSTSASATQTLSLREPSTQVTTSKLARNTTLRGPTARAKLKAEAAAKKAQDDKETRMTPLEYAAILQQKWQARISNTPPEKLFLKDKVIFLIFEEKNKASKETRSKLDIIARNGGQVAVKYDPTIVTHVIPGGSSITLRKTLRALDVKALSDIPSRVHTVKWDWIVSGLSKSTPDSEIMHESFKERLTFHFIRRRESETSGGKGKERQSIGSISKEYSVIEEFSSEHDSQEDANIDMPAPSRDPQATMSGFRNIYGMTSSVTRETDQEEDPLLPFYAKAREEAQTAILKEETMISKSMTDDEGKSSKLKGFQCDKKGSHPQGTSPNWDIIEKLAELREMHRDMGTDGDKWRVISYQKAIGSLKSHPTRIKSREEALKLSGISDKTADKIMEIVRTGELQRIKYTKTQDLTAMRIFSGIYGVGPTTARKWFYQGLNSLEDVKQAARNGTLKLSISQEIGLEFYEDINDRMPRSEAEEIFSKIKAFALSLDPKLSLDIMGSYRRGKETCGDIDILITRPVDDGKTHAGILPRLCNLLHKEGILTEYLNVPENWQALEATYRGLCRRDNLSKRRRIDFLCIPYECRGAARIYYTGDDIFNRSIRLKANKMHMSLNQRGLFQGVIRDPKDRTKKMCEGSLLCSNSEKKIFEILGVPWQEPHERVRG